jgi:restriction endonuclease S subunit
MVGKTVETDVPAIGRIPSSWQLMRLNVVAELYGRIGWQGLKSDEYQDNGPYLVTGTDFTNGAIDWDTCVHISEKRWEEAWQIKLHDGDLLITKDGTIGKLAIVSNMPGPASLNSGLMRIVPKGNFYDTKYLYCVLQTDVFTDWYRDVSSGQSTIKHLFQGDFIHFVFPLPPLEEQLQIVVCLDSVVGKLEREIAITNHQLDVLADYRKSLIQEVVTHGLDPDAELRPSGIDWIGNMPAHWQSKPFKYVASVSANLVNPDEYADLPEIDPENIEKDTGRLLNVRTVGEVGPISDKQLFHRGQVLYSKIRPSLNKVVVARREGLCSADMYPIDSNNDIKWLAYVMRSDLFVAQSELVSDRVKMPKVNVEQLSYFVVPVPPVNEQRAIADYLNTKTFAIDRIAAAKRAQLENLREQRQSIIYEYVTGKRRVV